MLAAGWRVSIPSRAIRGKDSASFGDPRCRMMSMPRVIWFFAQSTKMGLDLLVV